MDVVLGRQLWSLKSDENITPTHSSFGKKHVLLSVIASMPLSNIQVLLKECSKGHAIHQK
jgi:hypothetical protein